MSLRSGVDFVSLGLVIVNGVGLLGFATELEPLTDIPDGSDGIALGTDDDDVVDMEAMGRIETPDEAGGALKIGAPSASKFEVR